MKSVEFMPKEVNVISVAIAALREDITEVMNSQEYKSFGPKAKRDTEEMLSNANNVALKITSAWGFRCELLPYSEGDEEILKK